MKVLCTELRRAARILRRLRPLTGRAAERQSGRKTRLQLVNMKMKKKRINCQSGYLLGGTRTTNEGAQEGWHCSTRFNPACLAQIYEGQKQTREGRSNLYVTGTSPMCEERQDVLRGA